MKRRFAILLIAVCVLVSGAVSSGCGVRQGEENIQKAKQAKKQVEDVQHKLEKNLKKGQ